LLLDHHRLFDLCPCGFRVYLVEIGFGRERVLEDGTIFADAGDIFGQVVVVGELVSLLGLKGCASLCPYLL
jgi:hypothetical protein